jgi:alkylation response protein AidB-like acyl-CoA dehydrogenase
MSARPVEGGLLVSGAKKPCSLARSMTMLTASVEVRRADAEQGELAVVLVPASSEGVRIEDFWTTPVLAGAESDAVVLTDVEVPEALVVRTDMVPGGALDATHRLGFIWFELLMTASYAGIAAGLVEEALGNVRAPDGEVVRCWAQLRTTLAALGSIADALDSGPSTPGDRVDDSLLGEVLLVRYQLQDALPRLAATCAEALGGMAFIRSADLAHRLASLQCLAFHPPARNRAAAALRGLYNGRSLTFD